MDILAVYDRSVFQDFESFRRTEVDLVEDDKRLVLDEYISSFVTYDLEPGINTFKDISGDLLNIIQVDYPGYHNSIGVEIDGITLKTKLDGRPGIKALSFNGRSFLSTILGFTLGL